MLQLVCNLGFKYIYMVECLDLLSDLTMLGKTVSGNMIMSFMWPIHTVYDPR